MQEIQERPYGAMVKLLCKATSAPSYMSYTSYRSYRVAFQSANQRFPSPDTFRVLRVFLKTFHFCSSPPPIAPQGRSVAVEGLRLCRCTLCSPFSGAA